MSSSSHLYSMSLSRTWTTYAILCGALLSCFVAGSVDNGAANHTSGDNVCQAIYLLNVLPYPNNNVGYDRGFELLPAGHLAAAHINNRTDILNGLELKIVDIDSEACGTSLVLYDGHRGIFENIISLPCILGVIGLFCSKVTETVVPLISHPEYGYAQLAAATSPSLEDSAKFPYLFRTIASSEVFNEAVVAMMDAFNWTKVSVIYDSAGTLTASTASNFGTLIDSIPSKELLASIPILDTMDDISNSFEVLNSAVSTIGYYSVSGSESAKILCEAYRRNQLYRDGHVFMFHEGLNIGNDLPCPLEELVIALEGVFTLQYRLRTTEQSDLVSGMSYETYHQQYLEALRRYENETGMDLDENNDYANSLYDQVWTFALAMNNSLDRLNLINDSFEAVYQMTPKQREILTQELKHVSFSGASGRIQFTQQNQVLTSIDIFQLRGGRVHLIGVYDPYSQNISFTENLDRQNLPDDTPGTVHDFLPLSMGIIALTLQGALLILIIVNTVLLTILRKHPEIKSSSFYISLIIMAGCFSLSLSSVVHAVYDSFAIGTTSFIILCNIDSWLSIIGISLIIVPLLFRLLRIFHIFKSFHSTGKYWSDKYVIGYSSLLCSTIVILLIVWTSVDPMDYSPDTTFILERNQTPYLRERSFCSSRYTVVWATLTACWIVLILIVVVILAIRTRHIKHKNYKDTKKVVLFAFIVSVILAVFVPLSFILLAVNELVGAFFTKWVTAFSVSLLCQLFLFMPKIFPILFTMTKKKHPFKFFSSSPAHTLL